MRKKWLIAVPLVASCAAIYLLACYRQHAKFSGMVSQPGQVAPEFSLTDLNGHRLDLVDYRGRVVLLNFWATWCEPCRSEIPHFVDLQNSYRNRPFQIVGISLDDDAEPVRAFYREFKVNYPVGLGNAHLAQSYGGILGLPVSFTIACDGKIRARHFGEVSTSAIQQDIRRLLDEPECHLN